MSVHARPPSPVRCSSTVAPKPGPSGLAFPASLSPTIPDTPYRVILGGDTPTSFNEGLRLLDQTKRGKRKRKRRT